MASGQPQAEVQGAILRALEHSPVLLALDFDGTLAPLRDDPDLSRMLPDDRTAVDALAASLAFLPAPGTVPIPDAGSALPRVALALVSGRPLDDLFLLATPPPGTYLVGSHGAERGIAAPSGLVVEYESPDTAIQARIDVWETLAGTVVAGTPGARVERKPAGIAVHVRTVPDAATKAALLDAALRWGREAGAHVRRGHDVAELSVTPVTKGDALAVLRGQVEAGAVIYAGDDVTDEDAFAHLAPPDVSIKVGPGDTCAAHRLPTEQSLADVLVALAHQLMSRS